MSGPTHLEQVEVALLVLQEDAHLALSSLEAGGDAGVTPARSYLYRGLMRRPKFALIDN